MNLISIAAVFISIFGSGMLMLLFNIGAKKLKLILSFSGAYLFAISIVHLLPEIYSSGSNIVGICILSGFILQVLLEFFSEGIEHGHVHVHHNKNGALPVSILIALSLHSFLEGMPLAGELQHNNHSHAHESNYSQLLTGIVLHNIPIAMALMSMMLRSNAKKSTAIIWLLLFALMTPLGTLTTQLIGASNGSISNYYDEIMGIVVGIFLHISTTILFESSENHKFNLIKFGVILAGVLIALIKY